MLDTLTNTFSRSGIDPFLIPIASSISSLPEIVAPHLKKPSPLEQQRDMESLTDLQGHPVVASTTPDLESFFHEFIQQGGGGKKRKAEMVDEEARAVGSTFSPPRSPEGEGNSKVPKATHDSKSVTQFISQLTQTDSQPISVQLCKARQQQLAEQYHKQLQFYYDDELKKEQREVRQKEHQRKHPKISEQPQFPNFQLPQQWQNSNVFNPQFPQPTFPMNQFQTELQHPQPHTIFPGNILHDIQNLTAFPSPNGTHFHSDFGDINSKSSSYNNSIIADIIDGAAKSKKQSQKTLSQKSLWTTVKMANPPLPAGQIEMINASNIFYLVCQPYEVQRKSYPHENRCIKPSPIRIQQKVGTHVGREIIGLNATVKLATEDGCELVSLDEHSELVSTIDGSEPITSLDSANKACFYLKINQTTGGKKVRLLIEVEYTVSDGYREIHMVDRIYSEPFLVFSNKTSKM